MKQKDMRGIEAGAARDRMELSQEELAEFLGTSQSKISRWEKNPEAPIPSKFAESIRRLLNRFKRGLPFLPTKAELVTYFPGPGAPAKVPRRIYVELGEDTSKGSRPPTGETPPPAAPPNSPSASTTMSQFGLLAAVVFVAGVPTHGLDEGQTRQCQEVCAAVISAQQAAPAVPASTTGAPIAPQLPMRGGSVGRGALEATSPWLDVARASFLAEPPPAAPFSNQKVAPCNEAPYGFESTINGGCYIAVERKPPCSTPGLYEYSGKCFIVVGVPPKKPVSNADEPPTGFKPHTFDRK